MSQLADTLRTMGLAFEASLSGRWVRLQGRECAAYVAEGSAPHHFFTWCDRWEAREMECYLSPEAAILAGLRRAGGLAGVSSSSPGAPRG